MFCVIDNSYPMELIKNDFAHHKKNNLVLTGPKIMQRAIYWKLDNKTILNKNVRYNLKTFIQFFLMVDTFMLGYICSAVTTIYSA